MKIPNKFILIFIAFFLLFSSSCTKRYKKYEDTPIFVLRPEYLIAIMLQTNRAKDRDRILKLFDETEIDMESLKNILDKYDLNTAYLNFRKKFYEP